MVQVAVAKRRTMTGTGCLPSDEQCLTKDQNMRNLVSVCLPVAIILAVGIAVCLQFCQSKETTAKGVPVGAKVQRLQPMESSGNSSSDSIDSEAHVQE